MIHFCSRLLPCAGREDLKAMETAALFIINSILLGAGLAMDAFSVSLANGLRDPRMGFSGMSRIAGCFGFFQVMMPLLGWFLVRSAAALFSSFERMIPWIALALLLFLGSRMIMEGRREEDAHGEDRSAGPAPAGNFELLLQGVATSIDALSVGFTIASYQADRAVTASLIIGIVTYLLCMAGLLIGKRFGTGLSGKASVLGGCILIFIGLEIFLRGVL